jgi:hypothetical protein
MVVPPTPFLREFVCTAPGQLLSRIEHPATTGCKQKEEHKNLTPGAIQKEIDEAKQFTPPIGKYGILTTARVSTQAQRKVREINEAHVREGLFEVELLTWERLCELLQQDPEVFAQFYGEITPGRARTIEKRYVKIDRPRY